MTTLAAAVAILCLVEVLAHHSAYPRHWSVR
jgi:hypothetical protein